MTLLLYALADLAVGGTFLVGGLLVWLRRRTLLPALLLALVGGCWFLGNLQGLPGLVGAAAGFATYLHRGPLIHLVLTLPSGRPRSPVVWGAVAIGYAVAAVPVLAQSETAALLVSACLVGTTWSRRRWSVDALPVLVLAAGLSVPALARLLLPPSASGPALLWYDACLVVLAFVLAHRLLRTPRLEVVDLLVGLSAAPSQSLRDTLARTLGDPTLQVAYVAGDRFVDARGLDVVLDRSGGRRVTPLVRDGQVVGYLTHDAAVLADPALVDAVATAAALSADNVRLQADVARQAAQVRASRRRILTAGLEERQRLEGQLQHGPGARLDRVAALLDAVPDPGGFDSVLTGAQERITLLRSDLRNLARGLDPLALRTSGLDGAIADLTTSLGLPATVDVDVDVQELPDVVAATAYYVCAEGLANLVRHAQARSAEVRLVHGENELVVAVSDDGVGGADPTGTGLRGLTDRVEALGGRLVITSGPSGTELRAHVPTTTASP
jgi:signal transduction histidine kinase